jgi:hypothetical protein
MTTKQIYITIEGNTKAFFLGVIAGKNQKTNELGFIVYTFPANEGTPTDLKKGEKLADILFTTEIEALNEGEKIFKAKIKAMYAKHKKEVSKRRK